MITKSVVYPQVKDMKTFNRMVAQKDKQIEDIIQDKDLAIAKRDSQIATKDAIIAKDKSEIKNLREKLRKYEEGKS